MIATAQCRSPQLLIIAVVIPSEGGGERVESQGDLRIVTRVQVDDARARRHRSSRARLADLSPIAAAAAEYAADERTRRFPNLEHRFSTKRLRSPCRRFRCSSQKFTAADPLSAAEILDRSTARCRKNSGVPCCFPLFLAVLRCFRYASDKIADVSQGCLAEVPKFAAHTFLEAGPNPLCSARCDAGMQPAAGAGTGAVHPTKP